MAQKNGGSGKSNVRWRDASGQGSNPAQFKFNAIESVRPNTRSLNSTAIMRDSRIASRRQKMTQRTQQSLNSASNTDLRKAYDIFKAATKDIERGQYSIDRIGDDLYDSYDSELDESFDLPSGDEMKGISSEEITLLGNRGVAKSVIQSGAAQLRGMNQIAEQILHRSARNTEAATRAVGAIINQSTNSINNTLFITNSKLDILHNDISALIAFQNQNTVKYYEQTASMLNGLGKMMENFNSSLAPTTRKTGRYDISGGIKGYIDHITKGLLETMFGSLAGSVKGGGKGSFIPQLAGGAGGIVGSILKAVLPKSINSRVDTAKRDAKNLAEEFLEQIADRLDASKNPILQTLSGVLGNKREKITTMNLGAYSKEAMPWNGIAQKALTEVIPELLTSIEHHLGETEKRYYNYQTGKFMKSSDVRRQYENDYRDRIIASMNPAMQKMSDALSASGKSMEEQNALMKQLVAMIDDVYAGGDARKTTDRMKGKITDFGISEQIAEAIRREISAGFRTGMRSINDLNSDINTTVSVYRNLSNKHGSRDLVESQRAAHRDHRIDYSYFSKGDPAKIIKGIQQASGLDQVDLSKDIKLQQMVLYVLFQELDSDTEHRQLEDLVVGAYNHSTGMDGIAGQVMNSRRARGITGKIGARIEAINGGRLEKGLDLFTSFLDSFVYGINGQSTEEDQPLGGGNAPFFNQRSRTLGYGKGKGSKRTAATTTLTKRKAGSVDSRAEYNRDKLERMAMDATITGSTAGSIAQNDRIINGAITDMEREEPATDFNGSILQATNSIRTAMAALVGKFMSFGSSIFGKDGYLSKLWNSDGRKKITGRLFTDENAIFGNQYRAVKAWGKDVWVKTKGELGKGYDYMREAALKYKFGDDYEKNERYQNSKFWSQWSNRDWIKDKLKQKPTEGEAQKDSTGSVAQTVEETNEKIAQEGERIVEGMKTVGSAAVGDLDQDPSKKEKQIKTDFFSKMKKHMPKALAAGIVGAGVGMANAASTSLLGSMFLPGGPIAGAILGTGLSILTQTETFKNIMFGKMNENGERQGGLITQKTRDTFKKMLPAAAGGAAVGVLHGVLKGALGFNGGLGVLGMQLLPGGILGGALIGAGLGIVKHSDKIQDMLFGKKDDNGKRSGTFLSKAYNKLSGAFAGGGKNALKKGLAGAGIGALTGAVLSSAGFIPAMFSLGGPIGMGIAGFGLGIASTAKKFDEFMFGTKDKDGNRREDGMLTRVRNLIRINLFEPIGAAFKSKMLDLVDWTKDQITMPFKLAFGPIIDSVKNIKDDVVDFVKEKFESFGSMLYNATFGLMKKLFSPFTSLIGKIGKLAIGAVSTTAKIAMSPVSAALNGMSLLMSPKRRKEEKAFRKSFKSFRKSKEGQSVLQDYWDEEEAETGKKKNFIEKFNDRWDFARGRGELANAFRSGYNEEMGEAGLNTFDWRSEVGKKQERRRARKLRHEDERRWEEIYKLRQKIVNKDMHGNSGLTLSDRAVKEYRDKFSKAGVDEKFLQSSSDIMQLLYRPDEFKARMNGQDAESAIKDADDAQAERDKTRDSKLDEIIKLMGGKGKEAADDVILDKVNTSIEEDNAKARKLFRTRLRNAGYKKIDVNDPRLKDFDLSQFKTQFITDFSEDEDIIGRRKKKVTTDDLLNFFKKRNIIPVSGSWTPKNSATPSGLDDVPDANGEAVGNGFGPLGFGRPALSRQTLSLQRNAERQIAGNGITFNLKDYLSPLLDKITELLNVNKKQLEETEDQTQVIAQVNNMDIDPGTVKTSTGSKLKSYLQKLNPFRLLKRKEAKEARDAREAEEAAGAATGRAADEKKEKGIAGAAGETKEKKQGIFSKILGWFGKVGSALSGTFIGKAGSFIWNAVKTFGILGLLGGVGFSIAELVKPGTTKTVGEKVKKALDFMNDSENGGIAGIFNKLKEKAVEIWNGKVVPFWEGDGTNEGLKKKLLRVWDDGNGNGIWPTLQTWKDKVIEWLPGAAQSFANWFGEHVETITHAVTSVAKEIAWPMAQLIMATVKGLAVGLFDGITGKKDKTTQEGLSADEAKILRENGIQIDQKLIGTGATEEEARAIAEEAGFSNAEIQYDKATDSYRAINNRRRGRRVTATTTGDDTVVTNENNINMIGRTAAHLVANPRATLSGIKAVGKGTLGVAKIGTKVLSKIPIVGGLGKLGNVAVKGVEKVTGLLGSAGSKLAGGVTNLFGKKVATEAVEAAATEGAKAAAGQIVLSNGQTAVQNATGRWVDAVTKRFVSQQAVDEAIQTSASEVAEQAAKVSASSVGKTIAETGAFQLVQAGLKKFSEFATKIATDGVIKKLVEKNAAGTSSKILQKIVDLLLKIPAAAEKATGNVLVKISDTLSAGLAKIGGQSVTAVIGAIVTIGGGALFGAIDAANLFGVDNSQVTAGMRAVSAIIGGLLGIPWVGTILDIGLTLMQILGLGNLKQEIAVAIYSAIVGAESEQMKNYQIAKEDQDIERQLYNALNHTNLDEQSYNDLDNKTLLGKAWSGVKGLFTGKKEVSTKDTSERAMQLLRDKGMSSAEIAELVKDENKLNATLAELGYGTGISIKSLGKSIVNRAANMWNSLTTTFDQSKRLISNSLTSRNLGTITSTDQGVRNIYAVLSYFSKASIENQGNITNIINTIGGYVEKLYNKANSSKSVGNGVGSLGYGTPDFKQGSSRWSNMRIGTFANGRKATMKDAGCGPTAMSIVANELRGIGYGPISPAQMGAYAAKNGYISNGGANAGLFTSGAARLGMRSTALGDINQVRNSLASGRPTILTGRSSGGNDPYTRAGHIVVADRLVGNSARVLDPMTGRSSLYNLNNIARKTEHAWSYSLGYGPVFDDSNMTDDRSTGTGSSGSTDEAMVTDATPGAEEAVTEKKSSGLARFLDIIKNMGSKINEWFFKLTGIDLGGNTSSSGDSGSGGSTYDTIGGNGVKAIAVSGSDNAEKAWRFFRRNLGFNAYAAAGALGNFMQENGIRYKVLEGDYLVGRSDAAYNSVNSSSALNQWTEGTLFPAYYKSGVNFNKAAYKGSDGNWYPGMGLGSWTGPLGKKFLEYMKNHGYDRWDPGAQLQFYKEELLQRRPNITSDMNAASSAAAAAALFLDKAEMFDGFAANNMEKFTKPRQQYAMGFYDKYKNLGYGPDSLFTLGKSMELTGVEPAAPKRKSKTAIMKRNKLRYLQKLRSNPRQAVLGYGAVFDDSNMTDDRSTGTGSSGSTDEAMVTDATAADTDITSKENEGILAKFVRIFKVLSEGLRKFACEILGIPAELLGLSSSDDSSFDGESYDSPEGEPYTGTGGTAAGARTGQVVSKYVNHTNWSPNHGGKRNHKIDTVTIHVMDGNGTVEGCGRIFSDPARQASSTYGIDGEGHVGQYVDEMNRPWTSSSSANDDRAITFEVANLDPCGKGYPDYKISDKAYDATVKMVADVGKRHGIKQFKWKADPSLIGETDQQNMTVHRWFASDGRTCPGDFLFNHMGDIAREANSLMTRTYGGAAADPALAALGFGSPSFNQSVRASMLGFGPASTPKRGRIDDPLTVEQARKRIDDMEGMPIDPRSLKELGFGPGMTVNANVDSSVTDGRLLQIFSLLAEWYQDTKKSAAESRDTRGENLGRGDINVTNNKITNIGGMNREFKIDKQRQTLMKQHAQLSYRQNLTRADA